MKRTNHTGHFGFLVSLKKTVLEPGDVPVKDGTTVFYMPLCCGYTSDWRDAGLYSEGFAKAEVCRSGNSCQYLPVPWEYATEVLAKNKNPIEICRGIRAED